MRKNETGFTIIELIIVIAIIGILATVAIPKFIDLSQSARIAASKGSLGAVRSVIAIKYAQSATGGGAASFPTSIVATDFADNQNPKNALIGAVAGVTALTGTTTGLATSTAAGFWFVTGTSTDAGRAGAYSGTGTDSTVNTSTW